MSIITKESISDILRTVPIERVIEEHVSLKRRGGGMIGLCPFHPEKTPSFYVSDNNYHCFGCKEHGDVIGFKQKKEGLSFKQAVRELAMQFGITLVEKNSISLPSVSNQYIHCAELASQYYQENLQKLDSHHPMLQYLQKRGFKKETLEFYRVGYCPNVDKATKKFLLQHGVTEDIIEEVGFMKKNQEGKTFDIFRNRLMFPITNLNHKVIAFAGRSITPNDNIKYINTSSTKLYSKRETLYGLSQALPVIKKKRRLIIVEGYTDVLSLYESGFEESIAVCGSAFTVEHLKHITSIFRGQIIFLFDGDIAGYKSAFKAVQLFIENSWECFIALLPKNTDPDEFIRQNGKEPLELILERAKNSNEFLFFSVQKFFLKDSSLYLQERIIQKFLSISSRIKDILKKELFLNKIADSFRIDKNALKELVNKHGVPMIKNTTHLLPYKKYNNYVDKNEMRILGIISVNTGLLYQLLLQVKPADFENKHVRCILEEVKNFQKKNNTHIDASTFKSLFSDNTDILQLIEDAQQQIKKLPLFSIEEALKNFVFKLKNKIITKKYKTLLDNRSDIDKKCLHRSFKEEISSIEWLNSSSEESREFFKMVI